MLQAEYETAIQENAATILEYGRFLGMCHSTILNLIADSAFDHRLMTAYTTFVAAIGMSRDAVWIGYNFAMAHDADMRAEKNAQMLQSVGNFIGTWNWRLLETEFNLWKFGVVNNAPAMVQ
jgi:hypothetical protein